MATKDRTFVISFWMLVFTSICYLVAFSNEGWLTFMNGKLGLWKECFKKNVTVTEYKWECTRSTLAEGPAFLDVARTMACFAVVFGILGIFGFICTDHVTDRDTLSASLKFRTQEIGYFIASVCCTISCLLYGANAQAHYQRIYGEVDLAWGFYMAASCAGIIFVLSIAMFFSRDDTYESKATKKVPAPKTGLNKTAKKASPAEARKQWLTNKDLPTPVNQKGKDAPTTKVAEEIEVKAGLLHSIVAPTMVIIAMKRWNENKDKNNTAMEKISPPLQTADLSGENKYKGIFTVNRKSEGEEKNRGGESRLVIPPSSQRRDSSSSSSSSSSQSSSVSELSVKVVDGNTSGKTHPLTRPPPVRKHFSQGDASLRAQAELAAAPAVTEPKDGNAIPSKRPSLQKRHVTYSEDALKSSSTATAGTLWEEESGRKVNIYAIPPEPGSTPHTSPPDYEQVVGNVSGSVP